MNQEERLAHGLLAMDLDLALSVQEKLLAYAALLYKWNRTYNLTALREPALAVSYHLLDSLAILPYVQGKSLLDVGSGGGLPGVPMAIVRPDLRVTLVDSNSKKTAFLQQAAIELQLTNVTVHCGRVELYRPPANFSVIASRAFSELGEFARLSRHLLESGGHWLAMKGLRPDAEIERLPDDVVVEAVPSLAVPGVDGERHLVVMCSSDAPR
jgi:16S rRNA (guanine527-N7)-methyltransferase